MTDPLLRLNEFQLSVLREIGNIGAGHAATALSVLMQKEIDMQVPNVHIVSLQEIDEVIGGAEQLVMGVFLRVEGEISGSMFLMLTLESAKFLLQILMGESRQDDQFSEMDLSVFMEIGNILGGSYLSAMSDFTNKQMHASVPAVAIDMAGAILGVGLMHIGQYSDTALLVDTEFWQGNNNVDSHFFFLPDPDSVETIFKSLGVDLG
jgi:chemotaxis protein CheC